MAIFAVKTGLGWAYLWGICPRVKRTWASLAIVLTYAALFSGVALFVSKVNLLAHYETFAPLWRNGVMLHWLTAMMLSLWGIILLGRPHEKGCSDSKGWLALVIPCPVCLSVVLMSTAALALYFPEQAFEATAALFGAFVLVAALAGLIMSIKKGNKENASSRLGLFMYMTAAYFMLSALLSPRFSELHQVYNLAVHAGSNTGAPRSQTIVCLLTISLLAAAGFAAAKKRMKTHR
jgi:predicted transporter